MSNKNKDAPLLEVDTFMAAQSPPEEPAEYLHPAALPESIAVPNTKASDYERAVDKWFGFQALEERQSDDDLVEDERRAADRGPVPVRSARAQRKIVSVFVYDRDGNQQAKIDTENTPRKRIDAALFAAQRVEHPLVAVFSSVGGDGILAVLPDGTVGRVFPIVSTVDLSTNLGADAAEASSDSGNGRSDG